MCEYVKQDYPDTVALLTKLNKFWESKKITEMNSMLADVFQSTECSMSICLELIEHSRNKKKPNSIGSHILDQFKNFMESNRIPGNHVPDELKRDVLAVVTSCHPKLAVKLIKCFSVDFPSRVLIRERIRDMCTLKENVNDAISLTTALQMQDEFSIFDMAVPAYLQNKTNLVESYMQGSEKAVSEMLKLVDGWLGSFDFVSFCAEHGIRNVKGDTLRSQFHDKSLVRWLKLYGKESSASELCPNLCKRRAVGALKYLLYRYYVEKAATLENTLDLLKKAVGEDEALQEELLHLMRNTYCDYKALDVIESWFKTDAPLPANTAEEEDWGAVADDNINVVSHLPLNDCRTKTANGSDEDTVDMTAHDGAIPEKFYSSKLTEDCITIVDDFKSLDHCSKAILRDGAKVGVDAEWCISTGKLYGQQNVALLQLATVHRIFLLDVFTLLQSNYSQLMSKFLIKLFGSKTIIKIGFGLGDDLKKLSLSVPGLDGLSQMSHRIIDLHTVSNKLKRVCPQALKMSATTSAPSSVTGKDVTGLSKLAMQTIGLPLDKSEQISDWERRPLRPAQIKYAALDSYCLLEIYDVLSARALQFGLTASLEDILHNKVNKPKSMDQPPRGLGRGALLEKYAAIAEKSKEKSRLSAAEFHVVCDNMLQGLGRRLRSCGVDTRILTNLEDHDVAGKIAQSDNRVILTSGAPCQTLSSQVPIGRCFDVPNDVKVNEQLASVIEHFNVRIDISDIFSRCQLCNSGKYLVVSPDDMLTLIKLKETAPDHARDSPVPWDQYRSSEPSRKRDYTVVLEEDLDSDDENPYLHCGVDDKNEPCVPEASQKFNNITSESTSAVPSVSEAIVPDRTTSSPARSSYLINSRSLSTSSQLDFKNIAMITEQPGTGQVISTPLLCKQVPVGVCKQVTEFYCCVECGKVYWEGAHFGNVIKNYGDIISS